MKGAKTYTIPLHESAYRDLSMIGDMGNFTPVAPAFRDFSQAIIEKLLKRDLYGWRRFTLDYLEQQAEGAHMQGAGIYAPNIEMGLTLQFLRGGLMKAQRELFKQGATPRLIENRAKEEALPHESARALPKDIAAVYSRLALLHTEIERYKNGMMQKAHMPLITHKNAYSMIAKGKTENNYATVLALQAHESPFASQAMKSPWVSGEKGIGTRAVERPAVWARHTWAHIAPLHDMQRKTEAEPSYPHKRENQSEKGRQAPIIWRAFEDRAYRRLHIYTRENALMQALIKQRGMWAQAPHMHTQNLHSGAAQTQIMPAGRNSAAVSAALSAKGAMRLAGKPIHLRQARIPNMQYKAAMQAAHKAGHDGKTQAVAQFAGAAAKSRLSALPSRITLLKHVLMQSREAVAEQQSATSARETPNPFRYAPRWPALTFLEHSEHSAERLQARSGISARERMAAQAIDRLLHGESRIYAQERDTSRHVTKTSERDIERRITKAPERDIERRITEVSEHRALYLLERALRRTALKTPPQLAYSYEGLPLNIRREMFFDQPFRAGAGAYSALHITKESMAHLRESAHASQFAHLFSAPHKRNLTFDDQMHMPLAYLGQGAYGEASAHAAPARAENGLRGRSIYTKYISTQDIYTNEQMKRLLFNRTRFTGNIALSYNHMPDFRSNPVYPALHEVREKALGGAGNGAKRAMDFTARAVLSGGVGIGAGAFASNSYLPPYQNRSELAWREGGGEPLAQKDVFSERAAEQLVKDLFRSGGGAQAHVEEGRLRMRKLSRILHTHVRRDVIAKEALDRAKRGIQKQIARPADIMRFVPPAYRDAYGRTAPMGRMDWTELGYMQDGSPQPYREQRLAYHAGETSTAPEDMPAERAPLSGNAREAQAFLQSYARLYGGMEVRTLPNDATRGEGHTYAPLAYAPLGGDGAATAHIAPFTPSSRPMEQMVYRQSGRQGDMGAQQIKREIKSLNVPVQKKTQVLNADELPLTKGQIERLTDRIFDGIERRIRSERRRFGL